MLKTESSTENDEQYNKDITQTLKEISENQHNKLSAITETKDNFLATFKLNTNVSKDLQEKGVKYLKYNLPIPNLDPDY